jgi:hypothetical protein
MTRSPVPRNSRSKLAIAVSGLLALAPLMCAAQATATQPTPAADVQAAAPLTLAQAYRAAMQQDATNRAPRPATPSTRERITQAR